MIVVAIVAILAALAMPAYPTYTKRAKFTEIIAATGPAKTAMEICVQGAASAGDITDSTNGCTKIGAAALASAISNSTTNISSASTDTKVDSSTGAITIKASTNLDSKTFILTPSPTINNASAGQALQWNKGGNCQAAGLC